MCHGQELDLAHMAQLQYWKLQVVRFQGRPVEALVSARRGFCAKSSELNFLPEMG